MLLAPVLATAALLAPPPGYTPDIAAATAYARTRPGRVAFAVRTEDRLWGANVDEGFPSASVLKAMLLVSYLRQGSVRDRGLRRPERDLLAPMIRWSDSNAATTVRNEVGDAALVRLAHDVGMSNFRPAAVWGLSNITARDQTKFFLHIDRWLPPRHRAYGLRLLRQIVAPQRWGVGRVALPPGWTLYFKGGWGSGTGAVDHQVALLTHGDERVSVAVLTADDGTHAAGKATLQGLFKRLLRGL